MAEPLNATGARIRHYALKNKEFRALRRATEALPQTPFSCRESSARCDERLGAPHPKFLFRNFEVEFAKPS